MVTELRLSARASRRGQRLPCLGAPCPIGQSGAERPAITASAGRSHSSLRCSARSQPSPLPSRRPWCILVPLEYPVRVCSERLRSMQRQGMRAANWGWWSASKRRGRPGSITPGTTDYSRWQLVYSPGGVAVPARWRRGGNSERGFSFATAMIQAADLHNVQCPFRSPATPRHEPPECSAPETPGSPDDRSPNALPTEVDKSPGEKPEPQS
jgi:hypothetical protein